MRNRHVFPRGTAVAAAAALLTLLGTAACAAAPPPEPVEPQGAEPAAGTPDPASESPAAAETGEAEGSFTAAQARRGREEFESTCAECHATGEFRGRDFLFRWRRQSAWDFYRHVTTTMPEDAPGSLTDQQYVDVIAFILQLNGYAAGESELPAEREALERFAMDGGGGE